MHAGTVNLMAVLGAWSGGVAAVLAFLAGVWLLRRRSRVKAGEGCSAARVIGKPAINLRMHGICAVLGALGAYYLNYDAIMLFPALLAILALALRHPSVWYRALAAAMAAALWFQVHLTADKPGLQTVFAAIGLAVGLTLLRNGPERWQAPAATPAA